MSSLQFHIIWTIIELERGQFCSVRKCAEVRNIPVLRNIPVKYVSPKVSLEFYPLG